MTQRLILALLAGLMLITAGCSEQDPSPTATPEEVTVVEQSTITETVEVSSPTASPVEVTQTVTEEATPTPTATQTPTPTPTPTPTRTATPDPEEQLETDGEMTQGADGQWVATVEVINTGSQDLWVHFDLAVTYVDDDGVVHQDGFKLDRLSGTVEAGETWEVTSDLPDSFEEEVGEPRSADALILGVEAR